MSETEKKPTDAEEIFTEFQKIKKSSEESEQIPESETESIPEPESEQTVEETKEQVSQEKPETETSAETVTTTEETPSPERNVIYVGIKPIMTYVTATLTQLAMQPTVTIKARGKRITHAVDVSQMIVKRMNAVGFQVSDVRISSDSLTSQDGKLRKVSTIEIDISKT